MKSNYLFKTLSKYKWLFHNELGMGINRLQTLVARPQKGYLAGQKVITGMSVRDESSHQHVSCLAKNN
jgi:hypothetical protein